ncbi:MAG: O-antigen ligase family protein [Cyanobacteria bacterium REEB459]|nr:O-antigen ligase family protein [Cyanobacteria bacterium REEB459]
MVKDDSAHFQPTRLWRGLGWGWAGLGLGLYGLLTLLPGSSTLVLSWPWVLVWQGALLIPWLWLGGQLWQKPLGQMGLGHRLDGVALLLLIALAVSTSRAEFPDQARWYSWAALAGLATAYSLAIQLRTPARLWLALRCQGYLALALIVESLSLWTTQIYQPELQRLQLLQRYGMAASFSFDFSSLRNWQPFGHQNYVAGYLVLVLPLLAGLAWVEGGWRRWLWGLGLGLGLLDLYTTSSRAGWLALLTMVLGGLGIALVYSPLPRRLVSGLGAIAAALSLVLMFSNGRLRQALSHLLQGNLAGGELSYRVVTNAVGWRMGLSHLFTGLGPGSVPLVYQHYRPGWAGREAELQFQLHSTPAQLWGELGLWALLVGLALVVAMTALVYRWVSQDGRHTPSGLPALLVWCLLLGLMGFGLVSLSDYQLDIPAIAGVLCLYLATLVNGLRSPLALTTPATPSGSLQRRLVMVGLGLTLASLIWLIPLQRAWAISHRGFAALGQGHLQAFTQSLQQAHQLAPWEPYYPYQLGWNLGELSYQVGQQPQLKTTLLDQAIAWFERGNQIVPYQEFGHSNLGWLRLERGQPEPAKRAFLQAIQLVPAKPGVFFGLGLSYLQAGQPALAQEAMALEILRHPALLTSPIWSRPRLAPLYPALQQRLDQLYLDLLGQAKAESPLAAFLHQGRGALAWWRGDYATAGQSWTMARQPLHQVLLSLARGQPADLAAVPDTPAKYAILAWQSPTRRQYWLERAWLARVEDVPQLADLMPPPTVIKKLAASMDRASSFTDWLQQQAPSWQPRSGRLGFGVLSRHIDGPNPSDFYPRIENIAVARFFEEIFPSPVFFPALDRALQPHQSRLTSRQAAAMPPALDSPGKT